MTSRQCLQIAAGMIRACVPDLESLIGFLDLAGQKRLAAELRKQSAPTVRVTGQARCDPALWAKGSLR
jgi:hypothetical protein